MDGWLAVACLWLAGAGWGAQVSGRGVTAAGLALTTLLGGAGLALAIRAFLAGHDLPLVLGSVGALGAAALLVFTHRE